MKKEQIDTSHHVVQYNTTVVAGAWLRSAVEVCVGVAQGTGAGKRPNWPQLYGDCLSLYIRCKGDWDWQGRATTKVSCQTWQQVCSFLGVWGKNPGIVTGAQRGAPSSKSADIGERVNHPDSLQLRPIRPLPGTCSMSHSPTHLHSWA